MHIHAAGEQQTVYARIDRLERILR
jgi:hypothetical protein